MAAAHPVPLRTMRHAWRWYLLVWYPLWLLGGVLFLSAAWRATRQQAGG